MSIPVLSFHPYTRVMDCISTLLHFDHCIHKVLVSSHIYHGILSEPQCKRRNVLLENAEFLSLALLVEITRMHLPGGARKQRLVQFFLSEAAAWYVLLVFCFCACMCVQASTCIYMPHTNTVACASDWSVSLHFSSCFFLRTWCHTPGARNACYRKSQA